MSHTALPIYPEIEYCQDCLRVAAPYNRILDSKSEVCRCGSRKPRVNGRTVMENPSLFCEFVTANCGREPILVK
jgi:hypothetical protein